MIRYKKNRGKIIRGIKEIMEEAESLPLEERTMVVGSLLRTLNPLSAEIENEWVKVGKRRFTELRSGRVKPIPGDRVFA